MEWTLGILVLLSALIRLLLVCWGRIQDYAFDVPFTDVDYRVFTDAARYLAEGESPYNAPTYRYTPILAYLLVPNLDLADFGKLLFNIGDLGAAWLIHAILLRVHGPAAELEARWAAGLWLFNPITAIVSSRGNAESLVAVFVLASLLLLLKGRWAAAAVLHGAGAVSLKIYPLIYVPSVFLFLLKARNPRLSFGAQPKAFVVAFLCNWSGYAYALLCLGSFAAVSLASYARFGEPFLQQALLYHVSRVDIRHNFSPYFYLLYLGEGSDWAGYLGLAAFLPQAVAVLLFAFRFGADDLPFTWLLSTFAFVAFNKVCTSQYFVWYLCLVPLAWPELRRGMSARQGGFLVGAWLGAQGLWLSIAYLLEFRGWDAFMALWLASLLFLGVNAWILGAVLTLRAQRDAYAARGPSKAKTKKRE